MPAQQGYDSELQRRVEAAIARLEQQGQGQMEPLRPGQRTELRFPDQNDPFSYEQYNPNGLTPENQSPLTPLAQPSGGDRTALLEQMKALPIPPPGLPQARDQFLAATQGSTGQEGEAPIIPLWLRDQLAGERAMESTNESVRAQLGAEVSRMPPLAPAAPPPEPFTLQEGQTRFSGAGKALASVPKPPVPPAGLTPYQTESLGLQRQRLQQQAQAKTMSGPEARQIIAQIRTIAQSIKSDWTGDDPRTDLPIEQIMDSVAQELGTSMAKLSQKMLDQPEAPQQGAAITKPPASPTRPPGVPADAVWDAATRRWRK